MQIRKDRGREDAAKTNGSKHCRDAGCIGKRTGTNR